MALYKSLVVLLLLQMLYLNGWHPFESIKFDLVKITMWRCLVLQIWEQQKQLLRKQRVIQ